MSSGSWRLLLLRRYHIEILVRDKTGEASFNLLISSTLWNNWSWHCDNIEKNQDNIEKNQELFQEAKEYEAIVTDLATTLMIELNSLEEAFDLTIHSAGAYI